MDQCGSGKREKTSILRVGGVVGVEVQVDHEYMETWVKSNICERRRQVPKGVCAKAYFTPRKRVVSCTRSCKSCGFTLCPGRELGALNRAGSWKQSGIR